MKLLVSRMRELGTYVSREFNYTMQGLLRVHGWRHVEPWISAQHAPSPRARFEELLGEVPEAVLFWEPMTSSTPFSRLCASLTAACFCSRTICTGCGGTNRKGKRS
jgi:hypothetical protein